MRTLILLFAFAILSCGQNNTKEHELEQKEKELALRERELELREKGKTSSNSLSESQTDLTTTTAAIKYDYEKHNNIDAFINDLAKAVKTDDRNAVAKMTFFPFEDGFREWLDPVNPPKNIPNLKSDTEKQFLEKYSTIFLPTLKKAIERKEYRGSFSSSSVEDYDGADFIEEGEFVITGSRTDKRPYSIAIKKINGKFKLHRMVWSS